MFKLTPLVHTLALKNFKRFNSLIETEKGKEDINKLCYGNFHEYGIKKVDGTALIIAIKKNFITAAEKLLTHGADVNIRNSKNKTALTYAIRNDNLKYVVKFLNMSHAINIEQGYIYAIRKNKLDIVKTVVKGYYDKNIPLNVGLKKCIEYNRGKISSYLLTHDIPKTVLNEVFLEAIDKNKIDICSAISSKIDPSEKIWKTKNLLINLCSKGCNSMVSKVVKYCNINEKNDIGQTALITAIRNKQYNRLTLIKTLIKHKDIDINTTDNKGDTALMHLMRGRIFASVIKKIVERPDIDMNIINNKTNTALLMSIGTNRCIPQMISRTKNINYQNRNGFNALILAVYKNNMIIVNKLLEKGVDTNLQDRNGNSALITGAIHNKKTNILIRLIEYGCDIFIRNKCGKTFIDYLVNEEKIEIINKVISKRFKLTLFVKCVLYIKNSSTKFPKSLLKTLNRDIRSKFIL